MNQNITIYLFPFIGALIGWITNYIAVKMLFHPRKEIRIFFFKIQGVFPKRQKNLAEKLGQIVSSELFSIEDIKIKLKERANSPEVIKELENHIDKFLKDKLIKSFPMLQMFMNTTLIRTVKEALLVELKAIVNIMIEKLGQELHESIDVHQIVKEKVESFSSEKLEEIIFTIMKKEFVFIELIGGVLGFIIGLFQTALY
ncbi:MAG: YheB, partial [uncultured bacterium]